MCSLTAARSPRPEEPTGSPMSPGPSPSRRGRPASPASAPTDPRTVSGRTQTDSGTTWAAPRSSTTPASCHLIRRVSSPVLSQIPSISMRAWLGEEEWSVLQAGEPDCGLQRRRRRLQGAGGRPGRAQDFRHHGRPQLP